MFLTGLFRLARKRVQTTDNDMGMFREKLEGLVAKKDSLSDEDVSAKVEELKAMAVDLPDGDDKSKLERFLDDFKGVKGQDEDAIARMTKLCLCKNGYRCDIARDGYTAAKRIEETIYDLVLLDIMLPDMDGYELLEYIRQFDTPVIFVTARAAVPDRVKGLRLGAEDYITKPFDLEELLARVEAVLRRYHKTERFLEAGRIRIDTLSRAVYNGGEQVSLPTKEYDLLLFLVRNQGIALYRETIFEQVWREPYYGNTRTVDLHIQRLKKKLRLGDAIESIYKIGYKFSPEKLL